MLEQTTLIEDLWALVGLGEQNISAYLSLSGPAGRKRADRPRLRLRSRRINYTGRAARGRSS